MLFNHWYVAALAADVAETPVARVILGEPIVFYRNTAGTAIALSDRCAHRGYPLSAGTVEDGAIVCGYHGFTFDDCGACVSVPSQAQVPRNAAVRSYAVEQRGSFIWIWMGERAQADPGRIPDHHWDADPHWASFAGQAVVAARYGLVVDNLLDLSHETFLHKGTIGSRDVAETPITAALDGTVVHVSRRMESTECPPFYSESTGMQTPIDRWQDIAYHAPALWVLHVRIAPAGGPDSAAALVKIMFAITPTGLRETRLLWCIARNFAIERSAITGRLIRMQDGIIAEDKAALELMERVQPESGSLPEVSVGFDRGALLARRVLHALALDVH
jgi:vanillate O-demethylase monooxygenase subunit